MKPLARLREERGGISLSAMLLLLALAAVIYAALGASATDPDAYGSLPIPSKSTATLPGSEVELSLAVPVGAQLAAFPPPDLRMSLRRPGEDSLRVDGRGGEVIEEDGYNVRRVAVVFPSTEGVYEVEVGSDAAAAVGGRLLLGDGKTSAIGARIERVGELIVGPLGILLLVLIALALMLPSFQRALRRNS